MSRLKAGERKRNLEVTKSDKMCPRCDALMERRKHKEILNFLKEQPFYFSEWDYCRPCKYIQHYDEFKVINIKPEITKPDRIDIYKNTGKTFIN